MSDEAIWELAGKIAPASADRITELMDHATQDHLIMAVRVAVADVIRESLGNQDKS
jgi:hypothetical protein